MTAALALLASARLAMALQVQQQPEAQQLIGGTRSTASMCASLDHGDNGGGGNLRQGSEPNATLRECLPCWTHADDAPKLFIQESEDGIGARLHNIILGMAVAAKSGMNLGGIVSLEFDCPFRIYHGNPYNANAAMLYDFFFGLNSTDMFVNKKPPRIPKYSSLREFERSVNDVIPLGAPDPLAPGTQTMITSADLSYQFGEGHQKRSEIDTYLTGDFINSLRRPDADIMTRPLQFNTEGRPTVAVHVRRGDVRFNGIHRMRYTPDLWFQVQIDRILHFLPDADVHIFSSIDEKSDEHFLDSFRMKRYTVHTDTRNSMIVNAPIMDAWAHIARADIAILSRSSFGHVPAMLNKNCVIYQDYENAPLGEWIWSSGESDMRIDIARFNSCLRRIARPDWGILG